MTDLGVRDLGSSGRHALPERDRFGVKPLYLAEGAGYLAFASEIKALRNAAVVSGDPELDVVRAYLTDGTLARGSARFFKTCMLPRRPLAARVRRRAKAGVLLARARAVARRLVFARSRETPILHRRVRSLLIDSVALQLRSDVAIRFVPVGRNGQFLDREHRRRAEVQARGGPRPPGPAKVSAVAFFAQFREAGIDERPYVDEVVAATGVTLHTRPRTPRSSSSRCPASSPRRTKPFGVDEHSWPSTTSCASPTKRA